MDVKHNVRSSNPVHDPLWTVHRNTLPGKTSSGHGDLEDARAFDRMGAVPILGERSLMRLINKAKRYPTRRRPAILVPVSPPYSTARLSGEEGTPLRDYTQQFLAKGGSTREVNVGPPAGLSSLRSATAISPWRQRRGKPRAIFYILRRRPGTTRPNKT